MRSYSVLTLVLCSLLFARAESSEATIADSVNEISSASASSVTAQKAAVTNFDTICHSVKFTSVEIGVSGGVTGNPDCDQLCGIGEFVDFPTCYVTGMHASPANFSQDIVYRRCCKEDPCILLDMNDNTTCAPEVTKLCSDHGGTCHEGRCCGAQRTITIAVIKNSAAEQHQLRNLTESLVADTDAPIQIPTLPGPLTDVPITAPKITSPPGTAPSSSTDSLLQDVSSGTATMRTTSSRRRRWHNPHRHHLHHPHRHHFHVPVSLLGCSNCCCSNPVACMSCGIGEDKFIACCGHAFGEQQVSDLQKRKPTTSQRDPVIDVLRDLRTEEQALLQATASAGWSCG